MFSILKKIIPACLVPVVLVSSIHCSAVDLSINKELVEDYIESMYTKRALLQEQGAEDALLEYYNNQAVSDENKRNLSVVAQVIDLFTDGILGEYYEKWVHDLLEIPDSGVPTQDINDQYTNYTGFYRTESGGQLKCAKFTPTADGIICSSPDFTCKINFEGVGFQETGREFDTISYYHYNGGTYSVGGQYSFGGNPSGNVQSCYIYIVKSFTGRFSAYTGRDNLRNITSSTSAGSGVWCCRLSTGTNVPVIGTNANTYFSSGPSPIASWGKIVNIPEGILTQKPWEYFNTTLLPWVKGECDELGFDYRKICPYPDGYFVRDPQEPYPVPTAPNGTPIYNVTYPTEIVTEVVTDDNGEPVTDSNGEPVTEIVYETMTDTNGQPITETQLVTFPSELYDAEYEFQIPGLPELPTEYTVPEMELPDSSILAGIGGLFQAVGAVLESSGLFGILPFVFFTAFLIYLLAKIGG